MPVSVDGRTAVVVDTEVLGAGVLEPVSELESEVLVEVVSVSSTGVVVEVVLSELLAVSEVLVA